MAICYGNRKRDWTVFPRKDVSSADFYPIWDITLLPKNHFRFHKFIGANAPTMGHSFLDFLLCHSKCALYCQGCKLRCSGPQRLKGKCSLLKWKGKAPPLEKRPQGYSEWMTSMTLGELFYQGFGICVSPSPSQKSNSEVTEWPERTRQPLPKHNQEGWWTRTVTERQSYNL